MRTQLKIAALVAFLAATTIGTASAQSGNPMLAALGIQAISNGAADPNIDISNIAWIDGKRFSVEVVGESETEPRGLLGVPWSRRQVAEIELLEMPSSYCQAVDTETPCYLVARANEHDELKAPLGTWHVTDEDGPDVYTGLPSVGARVHISAKILSRASKP